MEKAFDIFFIMASCDFGTGCWKLDIKQQKLHVALLACVINEEKCKNNVYTDAIALLN
ncbi:hypothetical protein [Pseudoalteromonas sp. PS5]|uniref:hypothetical protein n=1 Tax=Pseudoalteromonas sp. PS5 TaxID=1437473 RepID=UPI001386E91C|nr:hypothetical protein [Pseudoalteromonas sp. PS5]